MYEILISIAASFSWDLWPCAVHCMVCLIDATMMLEEGGGCHHISKKHTTQKKGSHCTAGILQYGLVSLVLVVWRVFHA